MYKDVLITIEGIAAYPVISLVLFFLVFLAMLVWVIRLRPSYIEEMGNLPLEHDTHSPMTGEGEQHHA